MDILMMDVVINLRYLQVISGEIALGRKMVSEHKEELKVRHKNIMDIELEVKALKEELKKLAEVESQFDAAYKKSHDDFNEQVRLHICSMQICFLSL